MTDRAQTTADIEADLLDATKTIREHWPSLLEPATGARHGVAGADTITALERRIALRQDVARRLTAWCRVIIRDRPLRTVRLGEYGGQVELMLRLLDRHARWFSGHADAPQAARQLARLAANVEHTAEPPEREHIYLGPCPFVHVDPDDPATLWPCYGRVLAPIADPGTAHCTACRQPAVVEWWQDVLGIIMRPVTLPQLPAMLHRRLGIRVTDRTLRNWRRDGIIEPLPEPEIGPRPQWDRFDPRDVLERVALLGKACVLCGDPWDGGGEVCRRCWASTSRAKPAKAGDDETRPGVAGIPVTWLPTALQPQTAVDPRDTDRPERCHWSDLPLAQCACGRPHPHVTR